MSKYCNKFELIENEFYPTPIEAMYPLYPHLTVGQSFVEPCAGDGRMIDYLEDFGLVCIDAWDLEPRRSDIKQCDALKSFVIDKPDYMISNTPWSRELLNPMIEHFMKQAPSWLLFDLDWVATIQDKIARKVHCKTVPELLNHCVKIVPVGRVKWVEGSTSQGKSNIAWFLFDINHTGYPIMYPKTNYKPKKVKKND